jgi:glycosyltransferase involved in cell wall biosynthesis
MACGLPVITSVFNGVVDCIHDGVDGFVVREPRDAQKLAQIIQRLQADAGLKQNVGAAAAAAALEWSWSRNAEAAWELLKVASTKKKQTR